MNSPGCILKDKLLTALINNTLPAECQNIASDVQKGDIKLYNFVEALQPLLTNTDVELRKQSVEALSSLLASLPIDFLSEAELSFILEFYCDRLKDHYSILSATLKGILSIVQMKKLPENVPVRLLTTMFKHVQCQTLLLPDRQVIYRLFEILLGFKSSNLKSLGPDVVYGFINSIDGESDPRNLLILFRIIPFFVKEFSLAHLTEEMFEVIACYFPVHYTTPKSEGCGITREDLAEALAPCLCAIPEFAEFCLPLLIEKINSNLTVAKLDSLNVLSQGAVTFGVKHLEPHLREIWQALQKEIMQNDVYDVKNSALRTTTSLMKALAEDKVVCNNFVDEIIVNAKWMLCNAPSNSIKNAEKLLEAIAKASKEMCIQVLCAVVPVCLLQYSAKNTLEDKLFLMETCNNFIRIAFEYGLSLKNIPDLSWSDVPSFYLEELNNTVSEIQIKVIEGLIAQRASLNETQRATLYEKIFNEIETGSDHTIQAFHSCLYSFAESYPTEILNTIESRFSIDDRNVATGTIARRIEALSVAAKLPKICDEILSKFVDAATSDCIEVNLTALSCLRKLLTVKMADFDIHRFLHERDTINRLLATSISDPDQRTRLVSSICRLIVRKLNVEDQKAALTEYSRVLEGIVSDSDVALIDGFLIALHPDVELKSYTLLRNLYEIAVKSPNSYARVAACKLIAVLINKIKEDQEYERVLQFLKKNISGCLESKESEFEVKKAHCILLRWLTKALVKKGSANSQEFLDYQMYVLGHVQVGKYVASEFNALVDKWEDTLTEDNFCQVRILYKQRIFENIIRESSKETLEFRKNYLTALIRTAEEVPIELLLLYLTELVPCFVSTLTNEELIIPTLTVLQPLLETKNDLFALEAKYFIPKFLDLSSHENMKIRMAALNCLISYVQYPLVVIHPFKLDVLEKLHLATDDRKRLVRKIAVKARTKWFLTDSSQDVKT